MMILGHLSLGMVHSPLFFHVRFTSLRHAPRFGPQALGTPMRLGSFNILEIFLLIQSILAHDI